MTKTFVDGKEFDRLMKSGKYQYSDSYRSLQFFLYDKENDIMYACTNSSFQVYLERTIPGYNEAREKNIIDRVIELSLQKGIEPNIPIVMHRPNASKS